MSALVDLKFASGLELSLDSKNYRLIFGAGLTSPSAAIRDICQMQEVLLETGLNQPRELYYMHRDVHLLKDAQLLVENNLRYDVTVIKPDRLGKELMKTAGHYHPGSFGELYEVVEGRAFCLLQKPDPEDYRIIKDVVLVEAVRGQKIVIPPGYGHILINPGPGALVTSNWVSSRFSSEYELYKKAHGAAYFLATDNQEKKIEFIKNAFFKELAPIRFACPARVLDRFGLKDSPIYPIITQDKAKLEFLNYPERFDYSDIFEVREAATAITLQR